MIEKCASGVAGWLIKCGVVEETDRELYNYALYSIFLSASPIFLAMALGVCWGCIKQSVMIVIPFMLLRKFSGGYHTKHPGTCFVGSSLLLTLCIVLSFLIKLDRILVLITAGAAISLICFSPIDSENRELSREESRQYKKVIAILLIIFLFVELAFFLHQCNIYSVCVSIGIVLAAGLQLPCIFKKFWRE